MNKYFKLSWLRVRHCLDIFVMRYVAQYKNYKHRIINVGEIVPAKIINHISASTIKWANTLKQFVGNSRQIV